MPKDIDYTKPLLEVGKAYRITWRYYDSPDLVKDVYVEDVIPQYIIGTDRIYTYSYFVSLENPDQNTCHDYGLYLWNKLNRRTDQDLYNAHSIVELSKEDYPKLKRFNKEK